MTTDQEEITRITNSIIEALGEVDLQSALTVLCGLAGQLVAEMSEGKPSAVRTHSKSITENIMQSAIAKLVYDDEQRREEV